MVRKSSDRTIYTICRWACVVISRLRHYILQCMDTITGFSCASCPFLFTSPERIIRKGCALLLANVSDLLICEFCPMHYTVAFWHYSPPVKLYCWIFDTCRVWHGTPSFLLVLKTMFRILDMVYRLHFSCWILTPSTGIFLLTLFCHKHFTLYPDGISAFP